MGGVLSGVLVYEGLMRSPLSRHTLLFASSLIVVGAAFFYGFTHLFSGRGAFIHMGALIGSIMVNNVFYKIIPGQRKMVAQVIAGETVDPAPGLEGKRRSIHNNYLTLPVIFLMISNHYPMIYQHPHSWLVGLLVMLISAYIRHYFNLKHAGKNRPAVLISGIATMLALAVALSWPADMPPTTTSSITKINPQNNQQIALTIIHTRCTQCHSANPTDDIFKVAPLGAMFDNWQDIERWRARIVARSVDTGDMPFLNKTQMTAEERQQLKYALDQTLQANH
jgi:uncharacterized membrane protein